MRSTTLLALAVAHLAKAQTFSDCDPTDGDKCNPDPAFGECQTEQQFDFSTLPHGDGWKDDALFNDFFKTGKDVDRALKVDDDGLAFTVEGADQSGPLIGTRRYLFFGKVEVELKVAPGTGMVTSVVLESKDLDEIDWEWLGGEPGNVQTNFFSRGVNEAGEGTGPGNGGIHGLGFNAIEGFHKYTIDWTPDSITFLIDGKEVRKAPVGDKSKWPQTPMQVKIGIWAGGHPDNGEGTIEWAGGPTDFDQAPFTAWYKNLKVVDYCGGMDAAEEYVWSDSSGLMDSIEVVGSDGEGGFTADGSKSDIDEDIIDEDKNKDEDDDEDDDDEDKDPDSDKADPATQTDEEGAEETEGGDADAAGSDEGEGEGGDESAASIAALSSTLAAMVGLGYLVLA